jgi:allophanate hydrolase subunit 2
VENAGVLPVAAPEASSPVFPAAGEETLLRVVLGPRGDWFDAASITRFSEQSWEVSPRSDRVGARLVGTPLTRAAEFAQKELASEGTVLGAIQIPPDGQPVLFLADRPLTGGYPVIAVVHADDLELAAQLAPGCRVRFVSVAHTEPPHLVQPRPATPSATPPANSQKDPS